MHHHWSAGNKEADKVLKWTQEAAAKLTGNEGLGGLFPEPRLLVVDAGTRNHELLFLEIKMKMTLFFYCQQMITMCVEHKCNFKDFFNYKSVFEKCWWAKQKKITSNPQCRYNHWKNLVDNFSEYILLKTNFYQDIWLYSIYYFYLSFLLLNVNSVL